MEYLHLQRPIDGIWGNETIEGVQVKLTAMSDSGQYVDIGTTTTSGYYGTFGMTWTPAEEVLMKSLHLSRVLKHMVVHLHRHSLKSVQHLQRQ